MAKIIELEKDKVSFIKSLRRFFQSGKLNFLIGSGASVPAINPGGNIETELTTLYKGLPQQETEYNKKLYSFLSGIQSVQNALIDELFEQEKIKQTIEYYKKFIDNLTRLLLLRNNNLMPKRINIFSTNYDMFVEKACEYVSPLHVNDGFERRCSLSPHNAHFSSHTFSQSLQNMGDYYKSEIPTINILKIHGSLSWHPDTKNTDLLVFSNKKIPDLSDIEKNNIDKLKEYNDNFKSIILPNPGKLENTVLVRTYYDLLRIYSNELDKENSVLFVFGFSFNDEHIFEITKRSLKNPSLEIVIFAFNDSAKEDLARKFSDFSNVSIVFKSDNGKLNFEALNNILSEIKTFEANNG